MSWAIFGALGGSSRRVVGVELSKRPNGYRTHGPTDRRDAWYRKYDRSPVAGMAVAAAVTMLTTVAQAGPFSIRGLAGM
jgi:hypothetical protein